MVDRDAPIIVRSIHRLFDSHVSDWSKEVSSNQSRSCFVSERLPDNIKACYEP